MPARNLVFLIVAITGCVVAWFVARRERHGRELAEVVGLVESHYIEPVAAGALVDAAVDGLVATLDEHSEFVRGAEREGLEAILDQQFAGVGLELAIDAGGAGLVVQAPLPEGPAWRAGIVAGERITRIDGEETRGLALGDCVRRLRGPTGAAVTLHVLPPRAAAEPAVGRDVRLVRELVRVESVLGDRRRPDGSWDWRLEGDSDVGYLRITGFGERTAADLDAALEALGGGAGLRGLVIDLRGNPGGLVSAAVDVCDRFLDDGVVVSTRGRSDGAGPEALDVRRATAGSVARGVPLVVLVDGLTASAGEIVAACLQDHDRATVVGSRTYGKGLVQSLLSVTAGDGILKLTTAEYLRPSGLPIQRVANPAGDASWGVAPDPGQEVAPAAAELERLERWRRARDGAGGGGAPGESAPALPREVDAALARALEAIDAGSTPRPDLRREEEAAGDAHEALPAGV